ncbi:hypothetical protein M126_2327 [Bacteroides fragilis str. S6L3]|uniref:Uncharacterized protein n=1 Tax=Bacteroides fragilis str. S36L11 TaxID=1339327 RepID=A0A015XAF9_BACFG|nr:hypothetical protein M121_1825 [Bacteroides fragilis str. 3783N2-1]EXZ28678.1 hypothetical protein M136_2125 [Bacteroides fragilis str. S36L11]EYA04896.1 hypothetical protein M126_2327 [Bacteroides fragilis str. S6L3]EYE51175.1 hypothetical protein M127_2106 [Bacteroides fragilis str. S6L5]
MLLPLYQRNNLKIADMKTKLLFFFIWLVLPVTGCSAGEP